MYLKTNALALFCVALLAWQARATDFETGYLPSIDEITTTQEVGGKEKDKGKEKQPDKLKKTPDQKLTEPPDIDVFAQTPMSNEFPTGFNPHMLGDFPGAFVRKNITVFATQTVIQTCNCNVPQIIPTATTVQTVPVQKAVLIPVNNAGAFKIADNESPRPQDRVFVFYNYFDTLRGPSGTTSTNQTTITPVPNSATRIVVNTFTPGVPQVSMNLHREVVGFEKTFLDGRASFEMRVPASEQSGANIDGVATGNIGDITLIAKYAFILDRVTNNVLSGGLAVTAPTGPAIQTTDGTIHSTLIQPWVGYIWNADQFYIHAFHSLVVPSDARDVMLLFNDIGLNYWAYRGGRNQFLTSVVPLVEVHVTTPLNHSDPNGLFYSPNLVVMTAGVHLGLFQNSTLTLGLAAPVSTPRVFGIEAFVQFNRRF